MSADQRGTELYGVDSGRTRGCARVAKAAAVFPADFMEWTTFLTVGRPILIGSLFFALPAAVVVYFGLRGVLIRSHARRSETTN